MDTAINIVIGALALGVIGFVIYKIIKKKNPGLVDKVEDKVENTIDDLRGKL